MPSFGEADVVINATNVGKIRLNAIYAGSALYPRLCLRLGVALRSIASSTVQGLPPIGDFEITDVTGELRLSESGDVVGSLAWTGERRPVSSSSGGYEADVVCCCDLDHYRIEMVERRRNGAAPIFFLGLWPTLSTAHERLNCQVSTMRLSIPREAWLDFLKAAGGHEFEVLEIHYGPGERDHFTRGLEHVRAAREKLSAGEYDEAIARCRKVLEAAGHALASDESNNPLKQLLIRASGEKRGAEYFGIVSKLKQLGAFAHHDFGAPMTYSRAEAQFVVRVTESFLSLASHFAANAPTTGEVPAR